VALRKGNPRQLTPNNYLKSKFPPTQCAQRFFESLSDYLSCLGFKRYPYDWCAMNRDIEDSQETVLFNVTDIKLSHKNEAAISGAVSELSKMYRIVKEQLIVGRCTTSLG